jgi:phospholipid/cholesterol/gamma-HCH transport system permease protein
MREAATLVRGTTLFLFALAAFLGSSVASFGYFFLRSIGGSDALGIVTGFTDPRLAAPIIFGYAFTSKVCCGIVAEIGSMRVQQETEALEATGVDPRHYIVGAKVLATALFLPLGIAVALIGTTFGSWAVSTQILQGISSGAFLELHWNVQTIGDQLKTAVNLTVMGIATTLVACFYGLRVSGGPTAVGDAAARSLLVNLLVVHLVAAFFQVLFYGTDPGIPIGG